MSSPAPPGPPAGGLRVLLIEDQHDIAANIWDFLERRGHEVDHCADGVAGLARALRGGFDVIVLDLGLPRLDGLALCRRLREAGHGVPVLMLTARDTLDDRLRGFAGRRGLPLRLRMTSNYMETLKMLASVGLAWGVLPRTMLDRSLRVLPVSGLKLSRQLGCVTHAGRTPSRATQAFIALLDGGRDRAANA